MRHRRFLFVLALLGLIPTAAAQTTTSTSLAITAGGSPVTTVKQGTAITLTATVSLTSGGAAAAPGQVEFCEVGTQPMKCTDIRLLATVQLSSAGTAAYKFYPGAGTHTYQAIFLGTLGTHSQAPSASISTLLTVTPYYPTTTAVSAALGANGYTLTATVTTSGGTVPPTGTITFEDTSNNNFVLGTAPLIPGTSAAPGGLSFATSQTLATTEACLSVSVADVNGDGKPDIILGIFGYDDFYAPNDIGFYTSTVLVFLGNGDGTFTAMPSIPLKLGVPSIGVADVNGDGKPDLVVFESLADFGYSGPPPPDNLNVHPLNTVQVLLGNGDGTFSIGQAISDPNSTQDYPVLPPGPGGSPFAAPTIGIGDFNGDGIPDIALATGGGGTVALYFGNGDGTFKPGPITQAGSNPTGIAVGDFRGIGRADLAVTNPTTFGTTGTVSVLLGNGDGTFTAASPIQGVNTQSSAIVTGDFNGDGVLDLAVESAGQVNVFLGDGHGNFTQAPHSPIVGTAQYGSVLAVGDFNGDGIPDLITGSSTNADSYPPSSGEDTLSLLLGNGDGTFQPAVKVVAAGSILGAAISSVALGDFIGSGSSDIASADYGGYNAWVLLPQSTPQTAAATLNIGSIVGSGQHSIIAIYSGDSNYQPSTSPPLLLAAEPIQTTVTLTVSPTSTTYGQPVLMTATLTPATAQGDNATGTIAFGFSGTVTLGTQPIVNGVATFTSTLLPIGTDTVTAIYSGDPNFANSGGYTTEVVTGFTSVSVLTPTPNPSYVGQPVIIAAAVTGVGSAVVPAGTVTFYDNATIIGHGTLDATGHASMTTSTLSLGVHTLSFVYSGDLGYNPSTSPPVSQVVNLQGSATTLTASPNPAGTGQQVTLTAGVTLSITGTAGGSITFYDGPTQIDQTTLDATGHATFTTSTLTVGTHSLTAVYLGSPAYGGSTSPPVLEVIETAGFTLALSSPSITLATYQHTVTTVTLTSLGNFADSIALACANTPTYVTCIFTPSPAPLTGNGTATVSFYLDTDSMLGGSGVNGPIHGSLAPPPTSTRLALLLSPFTFFALLTTRRRAKLLHRPALFLILIAITLPAALFLSACGANVITPIDSTPPGTYTIPIAATGATTGVSHTTNLTLTVTP